MNSEWYIPYIIDKCWHIPFDQLSDLATVTMIGDAPIIKRYYLLENDSFNSEADTRYTRLQQGRYNYLLRCAGQRMIPAESRSESDFYPADEDHIFADVLNDLKIIKYLDQSEYPFLFKALRSRNMRDHLNCILLNMYSHDFPTVINNRSVLFLQTKSYLQTWSKGIGISGSRFSWQSHLIFLIDTGLIRKYVDVSKPIDKRMYRNVPQYTPQILRDADRKAKQYIDAGIHGSGFYERAWTASLQRYGL